MSLPFQLWDGDYDKEFYDVRLPSGEIVGQCWPNAGKMNETRGPTRRSWKPEDRIEVRFSADSIDR